MSASRQIIGRSQLEELYRRYNRREYVSPDPLQFLYDYEDVCDREVAGLVASSLAYGRVAQIIRSVAKVLGRMGNEPCEFVMGSRPAELSRAFAGFKHRFTTGEQVAGLLSGVKRIIKEEGSINGFFASRVAAGGALEVAMDGFSAALRCGYLVPAPADGSACKRLNLYLKWMVRTDAVDPGGWEGVPASSLIVPVDTHMHKIGLAFGFTARKSADFRTALEITDAFKRLTPEDPARYDFALTRFGIRDDMNMGDLLAGFGRAGGATAAP